MKKDPIARLAQTVVELLSDKARLKVMGKKARTLAHKDAAGELARMAAELAGHQGAPVALVWSSG